MEHFGIFVLALTILELNFSAGGAGGWNLLDILLPGVAFLFAMRRILQGRLYGLIHASSIVPLIFLAFVILHIFTDPRLAQISRALLSYRLPTGGFRLYYMIAINVMLYYACPIIMNNLENMRKFLKVFFFLVVLQIMISFFRMVMGIENVPWDSYTSQIHSLAESEESGIRLILLGNMGYLLFCYSIALLKPGGKRKISIGLGCSALLLAGGRAMLLGATIVGLLYLFMERRKRLIPILSFVFLFTVLAIFSFNPSLSKDLAPLPKKYLTLLSPENLVSPSEDLTRPSLWKPQVEMVLKHPFWGTMDDFPDDINEGLKESIVRGDTHNVYLGIASCFGIPALILWGLFFLRQLRRIYRLSRSLEEGDGRLYAISRWIFYSAIGYSLMYFAIGGAEGGHQSGQLIFSLVDVIYILAGKEMARYEGLSNRG